MEISDFPIYNEYKNEKKIAFLDNSVVSFMHGLDNKGFKPDILLTDYDVILVPKWVAVEILDSPERASYMQKLIDLGLPIKMVEEVQYGNLIGYREGDLFKIVCASVSRIADIKRYLRKNVFKADPIDMDAYNEWIQELYDNWPLESNQLESGRIRKKNAGEISITILAEIFSWSFSEPEVLTIYSQDRDTYEYLVAADDILRKDFDLNLYVPVSYKSNDAILCQLFKNGSLTEADVMNLRTDKRRVKYIQTKADKSVVMNTKVLENEEFIQLLNDDTFQILF